MRIGSTASVARVVRRIASRHSSLFARLGQHQKTDFLIDPVELPFALHLRPDPQALVFRAVPRDIAPAAGAVMRGRFMLLLELMDSEEDGDAAFFSRDLEVSSNTRPWCGCAMRSMMSTAQSPKRRPKCLAGRAGQFLSGCAAPIPWRDEDFNQR